MRSIVSRGKPRCLISQSNLRHLHQTKPYRQKATQSPSSPPDDYYSELLSQPLPISKSARPTDSTSQVSYMSPLAGVPTSRRRSRLVADAELLKSTRDLPDRPEEPDNCCMSGCVNCVWDSYREEVEEWAANRTRILAKRRADIGRDTPGAGSMDDDGGGSETNWVVGDFSNEDDERLFEGIPVGIREFMLTEKRVRERRKQEQRV